MIYVGLVGGVGLVVEIAARPLFEFVALILCLFVYVYCLSFNCLYILLLLICSVQHRLVTLVS